MSQLRGADTCEHLDTWENGQMYIIRDTHSHKIAFQWELRYVMKSDNGKYTRATFLLNSPILLDLSELLYVLGIRTLRNLLRSQIALVERSHSILLESADNRMQNATVMEYNEIVLFPT